MSGQAEQGRVYDTAASSMVVSICLKMYNVNFCIHRPLYSGRGCSGRFTVAPLRTATARLLLFIPGMMYCPTMLT